MTHRDIRSESTRGNAMETMSLDEISNLLKISKGTARNRLSLGLPMPPSFRVGRRRLFLVTEVQKWLSDQVTICDEFADE
jgi:hypothetical protein